MLIYTTVGYLHRCYIESKASETSLTITFLSSHVAKLSKGVIIEKGEFIYAPTEGKCLEWFYILFLVTYFQKT